FRTRRSRSRSSSRSRSRSRTRSYSGSSRSRSRSRSPRRRLGADNRGRPGSGRIDKAKLLAIARKKAQKMQLVSYCSRSYCQQIQRRQDKEDRREKGEAVSSDDDKSGPTSFKHPFGSDGIKINIVNATSISTKSPQERILDSSQLRLVYPVSSGITHKENTDKWTPVVKSKPLKTCSDEQKKYVGITSLEAERYRAGAVSFHLTRPQDVANVLARRADAQLKLATDPNDYEAIRILKEADDQMASWAAAKNLPGKFTGSTGVNVLSPEELQPHDPRYNAWVKKDMFKNTRPTLGGVGMRLMQKMGWRPGEGLGPNGMGATEPLLMDVKNDRKGEEIVFEVLSYEGICVYRSKAFLVIKHPVSMVMELCTKRKWDVPTFKHSETGPSNMREFRCSAVVNGIEYQSNVVSRSKKDAKSVACRVVLQSLGLIPRDPTLPVVIK
uniref:G-patch domain-containing protein n=1 Tax=Angiostrongylus cantonensis TaxID=6313 RepID=A0A0K0DHY7_ANGCA